MWEEPIHKPGPSYESLRSRLLIPGNFPPGILEHLPSARPGKGHRRDVLYVASTAVSQARVILMWAPFIDTALHISAYQISSYSILDDYVPFFERTVRKLLRFVDLLSLKIEKSLGRQEDKTFVWHLLEDRAQRGRITMIDGMPGSNSLIVPGYEEIVEVRE